MFKLKGGGVSDFFDNDKKLKGGLTPNDKMAWKISIFCLGMLPSGGGDNNDNDNDADNDCDSNNDNLYKMTTPSLFVCVFVFLPVTSRYPCG